MSATIQLPVSWQEWEITEMIGSGAYGTVYKAVKFLDGEETEQAAIKIIRIPSDDSELSALVSEYPNKDDQIKYYDNLVQSMKSEIHAMEILKENPHCVALDDYYVEHEEGSLLWTIFIRMELLQPLSEYLVENEPDEEQLVKLGIDICHALETCQKNGILHRDIKPENIMIDKSGSFKLGDFGVAKEVENLTRSLSVRGTFTYMAPEIYHGEDYDILADEYSLGIVLYRLLNNNRDPFTDPDAPIVYFKDREAALKRRMRGEKLPDPTNATEELAKVITKACSYRPEDRYQTITEFKKALGNFISYEEQPEIKNKTKHNRLVFIPIALVMILSIILVAVFVGRTKKNNNEGLPRYTKNLLWGSHVFAYGKDMEMFGIGYMDIDTQSGKYSLSAVPYAFEAGPSTGLGDMIFLVFEDKDNNFYIIYGEYEVSGNILTVFPFEEQESDDERILFPLESLKFEIGFVGNENCSGDHVIKNTELSSEASYISVSEQQDKRLIIQGKLSGEKAYKGIESLSFGYESSGVASFYMSSDYDKEVTAENVESITMLFTDGGEAIDATIDMAFSGYISINYDVVKRIKDGEIKWFSEGETNLKIYYINCYPYGFVIFDEETSEYYYYQDSDIDVDQ